MFTLATTPHPRQSPDSDDPLGGALAAVTTAIAEVADWDTSRRLAEADRYADTIACGADVIWADPKAAARAEVTPADVLTAITNGLAVLAHRPGGVRFGDLHWCVAHYPQCPGQGRWDPGPSRTRAARGAFYTPRELAERLIAPALAPHTNGVPSTEILSLRVCDPAVGSGSLLVAACRYLAEQLVTAWHTEAGDATRHDPAPAAITQAARRLAMRCLYGADLDPLSVDLARLAVALLCPTVPDQLRVRIVAGDALVGYGTVDQVAHMDPACFPPDAPALHWPLVFPEVFVGAGRRPGFDVVVSNPPFLGGQKIGGTLGRPYRDYLVTALAGGKRGSADLCAYVALRCHDLVHEHGTVGLIATNTLAQGSTREVGLDEILERGWTIVRAVKSEPWPSRAVALQFCMVWTDGGDRVTRPGNWPRRRPGTPALETDRDDADYEQALLHAIVRLVAD
jgi:hypothetical protein